MKRVGYVRRFQSGAEQRYWACEAGARVGATSMVEHATTHRSKTRLDALVGKMEHFFENLKRDGTTRTLFVEDAR